MAFFNYGTVGLPSTGGMTSNTNENEKKA